MRGSELICSRVVQAGTLGSSTSWNASSSLGWQVKGLPLGRALVRLACPGRLASDVRRGSRPRLRARQQALESRVPLNDGFQTIRGRSRPSELTIRATLEFFFLARAGHYTIRKVQMDRVRHLASRHQDPSLPLPGFPPQPHPLPARPIQRTLVVYSPAPLAFDPCRSIYPPSSPNT